MADPAPFAVAVAEHGDLEGILDLFIAVAGEARWIATEIPVDRDERRRRFRAAIDSEGYFRRHLRRASGELWDVIPMAIALE